MRRHGRPLRSPKIGGQYTLQYSIVHYNTVMYSTVQYSTVRHCTGVGLGLGLWFGFGPPSRAQRPPQQGLKGPPVLCGIEKVCGRRPHEISRIIKRVIGGINSKNGILKFVQKTKLFINQQISVNI